jgi:putative oxidoreductase
MNLVARISNIAISPLPVPTAWYAIPLRLIVDWASYNTAMRSSPRPEDSSVSCTPSVFLPHCCWLGTILVEIIGGFHRHRGVRSSRDDTDGNRPLAAIFTVHLSNGFSSIKLQSSMPLAPISGQPGYETDLLYLAGLIALCLGGAGPISVDGLLRKGSPHE